MKLIEPNKNLESIFQVMVADFKENDQENYKKHYEKYGDDFSVYLKKLANDRQAIGEWPEMVPAITYWLVNNDETVVLAEISLRLRLNKQLLSSHGGHIGYRVPPKERRKGHGTLALKLALDKAREHKIDKILVTCDVDNVGSNKIIQNNGGILDSTEPNSTGRLGNRYWINLEDNQP